MNQQLQSSRVQVLLALCATPIAAHFLRRLWLDYQGWLALGAGGMPFNVFGWAFQHLLRLAFAFKPRDVQITTGYENTAAVAREGGAFLGELPERKGARPRVGWWAAPHRQLEQPSARDVRELQKQAFDRLAAENASRIEVKTSRLEKHGPALYVKEVTPQTQKTSGEFAHVHFDAEGSTHVILAQADAEKVLAKAWGERHILSPCAAVPPGYLLLYAPQNGQEVDVLSKIMRASMKFALGT